MGTLLGAEEAWFGGCWIGVPRCDTGGRNFESDFSKAVVSVGGGGFVGIGFDGAGVDFELDWINPALVRDIIRSEPPFAVAGAAAWFWMALSWEWLASRNAGMAARICGVLGFATFDNKACNPFKASGVRIGGAICGGRRFVGVKDGWNGW